MVARREALIGGDVQAFPADALAAVDHAGMAAGETVPGDPPALLGVDVHELTGVGVRALYLR